MNITINNKPVEIDTDLSLKELAEKRNLPSSGVAVAVNDIIVLRPQWADYKLKEGDNVVIIGATYGG